jgi:hypothetical protein
MMALDLDTARRQMADTADVVQSLADRVHEIAESLSARPGGLGELVAAVDVIAVQARVAAQEIGGCLARGSRWSDHGPVDVLYSASLIVRSDGL